MARYAIVIGIATNLPPLKSLSKTAGDAAAIADLLEAEGDFVEVRRLIGEVSQAKIENALQTLLLEQADRNEVVIYYTGHGFPLVESFGRRRVYLAPSDCRVTVQVGQVGAQVGGIALEGLNGLFQRANLSNLVVFLECCYSGAMLDNTLVRETMTAFSQTDYALIAACREFETAYAMKSDAHSVFTTALLRGLREKKNDRGQVTTGSLFDFVYEQMRGLGQEPMYLGLGRSLNVVSYPIEVQKPIVVNETNPYQGLNAFTADTRQFFFGRDDKIQELVQAVEACGFVPVIGASGSGKSSIVRAGLIPRLEELGWRVLPVMMPGTDPIAALQGSIEHLNDSTENTLLVVDQFEEVFTLCRDRSEQSKFIQALMNLNVRVVVTMRADFVEACLANADLTRSIQADAVYLGPMVGTALEAAIEHPAIVQGARLQPKLLAQILQDVEEEENCLPLLEFTLFELWERRTGAELTFDSYRKLEGVTGALNAHADEIYKQLAIQKREHWVKRVMLQLVRTGEGTKDTRQRQYKADLLEMAIDDTERESIEAVINALVNGRLLVSDRIDNQDVIDLSHEALMRSWKRLVTWREGDREVRRIVDAIEDARRVWTDKGKKRRDLLEGRLLKNGKRLLKDVPAEVFGAKGFIRKSLWWRRSELAGLLMIPIFAIGLPAEYFWRKEIIKQDYERITRIDSGDLEKRAAVLNLSSGCWFEQKYHLIPHTALRNTPVLAKYSKYFRERIFGNCRSLQGMKLDKAILGSSNIAGADFVNASLSRTSFFASDVSYAFFWDANLNEADFYSANLRQSSFWNSNLSESNLINSDLSGTSFSSANLSRAKLNNANMSGIELRSANLKGANLKGVKFACLKNEHRGRVTETGCPNFKDIQWDESTNWQNVQGWETVENIPLALKQQLGLNIKKVIGVGIQLATDEKTKKMIVISLIEDSPASQAGVLAKDIIIKINDQSTEGIDVKKAVTLIRGEAGTSVKLTIQRGMEIIDYNLKRDQIAEE